MLALSIALLVPSAASAHSSNTWYWGEGRAERALELFEPEVAVDRSGADCVGTGRRWRGLWKHFNCDLWDEYGDYLGSGTLHVRGHSMRRYTFTWD